MSLTVFTVTALAICVVSAEALDPQGLTESMKTGPMGFLCVYLDNMVPWITSFILDAIVIGKSVKLAKNALTCLCAVVLGYPAVWLPFTSFLTGSMFGGMEAVTWTICVILLIVAFAAVKCISYWIVNDDFPEKKMCLKLFGAALAMQIIVFLYFKYLL